MPDLGDLDAFTAVAAERSFRAAARLRGVSASSLSEAVRRLEKQLGVRLLNRTTRSVTPTEAGARLFDQLGPALGEIATALDTINRFRDTPTGTLRINVPGIVAHSILPPIVNRFLAAHPDITMEVTAEDAFIDVLAAGYDAGIRYEESVDRDMIAVPIGPRTQRFAVAAASAYLAARGTPAHPRELADHACIRHRFLSGRISPWEFAREGEVVRIAPAGPFIGTTIGMELSAAIAGLGIICTFEDVLREAIAAGELAPILADWWPEFSGPYLYYSSRRYVPAPLRAFIDFVRAERPR